MFDKPIELYIAYIAFSLIFPFMLGELEPLFHMIVTIFTFIIMLIMDYGLHIDL